MRSAETSGAGAKRFGAGKGHSTNRLQGLLRRAAELFRSFEIAPTALAVALTAFLAAGLFVIYDTTIALPPAAMPGLLTPVAMVQAETALVEQPRPSFTGVAQRGAGAVLLAAALSLLAIVIGRRTDQPGAAQRLAYRSVAAAIPMGVACWTRTGQLIVCNAQYRERLLLENDTVSYHDAVKRLIVGGYMKLLNEDDNNRLIELHREDGSCLLIDERPLGDGGFMTLVTDVTERKKTDTLLNAIREEQRLLARRYHEEKLKAEAASKAKSNFLHHISHDIRTPLNHIIGFADLMRHQTYGPLGDRRYAEYVGSIKNSGEHLLTIFAAILDLTELESGQKALRCEPVPVDSLLDGMVQRFRGPAARAGLTFVLGEACGAVVHGDPVGMHRMLGNIVENAIRFTPSGGRVTLAAFAARDGVVLEISDTGIGMSEERLQSLSQPFALGDASFSREGAGPGLGISISRAIAEQQGGHIAIDSSPALGTTVAISLPVRAQGAIQAAE